MPKILHNRTKRKIAGRKKLFIEAYKKSLGNITDACDKAKIARRTYYDWLENDENFKKEIEQVYIEDLVLDIAESKLHISLLNGEKWAICKVLDTKGLKRGYHPRALLNIETLNQQNNNITIENLITAIESSRNDKLKKLEEINFE